MAVAANDREASNRSPVGNPKGKCLMCMQKKHGHWKDCKRPCFFCHKHHTGDPCPQRKDNWYRKYGGVIPELSRKQKAKRAREDEELISLQSQNKEKDDVIRALSQSANVPQNALPRGECDSRQRRQSESIQRGHHFDSARGESDLRQKDQSDIIERLGLRIWQLERQNQQLEGQNQQLERRAQLLEGQIRQQRQPHYPLPYQPPPYYPQPYQPQPYIIPPPPAPFQPPPPPFQTPPPPPPQQQQPHQQQQRQQQQRNDRLRKSPYDRRR
ncbi:uncharacterized protein BKA78DRAFT_382810 [Phyllosticta capitalensis]|uniref:uncharacterized protein n=1 Tax=Phyllosticta capitalensis TaxID=121624 RepID=UPI00312E6F8A